MVQHKRRLLWQSKKREMARRKYAFRKGKPDPGQKFRRAARSSLQRKGSERGGLWSEAPWNETVRQSDAQNVVRRIREPRATKGRKGCARRIKTLMPPFTLPSRASRFQRCRLIDQSGASSRREHYDKGSCYMQAGHGRQIYAHRCSSHSAAAQLTWATSILAAY